MPPLGYRSNPADKLLKKSKRNEINGCLEEFDPEAMYSELEPE
jgi:hypothetical protein